MCILSCSLIGAHWGLSCLGILNLGNNRASPAAKEELAACMQQVKDLMLITADDYDRFTYDSESDEDFKEEDGEDGGAGAVLGEGDVE